MTANIEQLRALAERLAGETGPDRAVDLAVWKTLTIATGMDLGDWGLDWTNSIDAAMSMVERIYPSLIIVMCRCADGRIQIREVWDAEDDAVDVMAGSIKDGNGGLSILIALVAALIAQAESTQ